MTKTFRKTASLAAVTALALGAAACGEEDNEGGKVDTGSETPETLQLTVTEQGKTATLEAPAEAKSGIVKISLKNQGKKVHEAQIVRVTGGQSAEEVVKAVGGEGAPIPEWIEDGGGVGSVAAGRTGDVIQELAPGDYVVFDTQGDKPVTAEFKVTDEKGSDADFPETEATITAKDYSFETSGLKAGDNVITFENTGQELHHAIIFPVRPGAKFSEVKKALVSEEEPKGPPPIDFEKAVSTAVIDGGIKQVTRIPMDAGKYAFVCFIGDRKGGPPHAVKGMITEVDVK
jgi:hypothetical protein